MLQRSASVAVAMLTLVVTGGVACAETVFIDYRARAAYPSASAADARSEKSRAVAIPPQFPPPDVLTRDIWANDSAAAFNRGIGFDLSGDEYEAWTFGSAYWSLFFSEDGLSGSYRTNAAGVARTGYLAGLHRTFPNREIAIGEIEFLIDPFTIQMENPVVQSVGELRVDVRRLSADGNRYSVQLKYGDTFGGVTRPLPNGVVRASGVYARAGVWSIGAGQPRPLPGRAVNVLFEPVYIYDEDQFEDLRDGLLNSPMDLPQPPVDYYTTVAGRATAAQLHQAPVDGAYGTTDALFFGPPRPLPASSSSPFGDAIPLSDEVENELLEGYLFSAVEGSPLFASFSLPQLGDGIVYSLEIADQTIEVTGDEVVDLLAIDPLGVPNLFLAGLDGDPLGGFANVHTVSFASEGQASYLVVTYAVPEPNGLLIVLGATTSLFGRCRLLSAANATVLAS